MVIITAPGGVGSTIEESELNFQTYELVTDVTLTVAANSWDISSLSLASTHHYMIFANFELATDGGVSMFINDDTTATNYDGQVILGNNSSITATHTDDAIIAYATTTAGSTTNVRIYLTWSNAGNIMMHSTNVSDDIAVPDLRAMAINHSGNTEDPITKLTFTCTTANNIAGTSRVTIYRIQRA